MANETGDNATLSPAQEALAEIKAEEADNSAEAPKAKESEDDKEKDSATADEGTEDDSKLADEPLTPLEDEDDPDEEKAWELDPKIKEAIGDNAEALAAWERQTKGLAKKEKQLAEKAEALETNSQGYEVYTQYVKGFQGDSVTAGKYLMHLNETVAAQHGTTVEALLGLTTAEGGEQWDSDGEKRLDARNKRLETEIQELRTLISGRQDSKLDLPQEDREALNELKAERERRSNEARKGSWLNDNAQRVIAKVAKAENWGVTKEMVAEAFDKNPRLLASDPAEAMIQAFPRKYAEAKASPKKKSEMPDLNRGGQNGQRENANPLEWGAADELRLMKAEAD